MSNGSVVVKGVGFSNLKENTDNSDSREANKVVPFHIQEGPLQPN